MNRIDEDNELLAAVTEHSDAFVGGIIAAAAAMLVVAYCCLLLLVSG